MSILASFGPKRPLGRDIKAQRAQRCDELDFIQGAEHVLDNINRLPLIDTSGSVAFKERLIEFIANSDDEDVKKVHVLTNIDLKKRLIHATQCLEAELHGANWTAITKNINACVPNMDSILPHQVFQTNFKSNEWIMRNALVYLSKHPYCVYDRSEMRLHDIAAAVANVTVDTYVVFDDAAYTGSQLTDALCNDGIREFKNIKRLFIVCLFMSKDALHAIKMAILDGLRQFGPNSHGTPEDWDEFKPPQELNKSHMIREDVCWFVYHNTEMDFDVYLYKAQIIESNVTLFEHKLPDYASFDPAVARKLVHLMHLPPYKDASKMVDDYNEDDALDLPCVGHYIDWELANRKAARPNQAA